MGIFRSAIISRKRGISESKFREHWIKIHGALAFKLPGLGSYRQNHVKQRFYEKLHSSMQAIDGISQLAFDSVGDMEISDASPEYAAVKADIPNFQGAITILVLQNVEVWSESNRRGPVKILWLCRKRQAMENIVSEWSALDHPRVPGAIAFVQNFIIDRGHPVSAGVPVGDAQVIETISELWFESELTMRKALESDEGKALIYSDPLLAPMAVYQIDEITIR